MKLYDISMPIHPEMPVYKNKDEKRPSFDEKVSGEVTETILSMNLHTGTHVDGKKHMVPDGASAKEWGLAVFVGSARVLDFTYVEDKITAEDIESKKINEGDFVLLKTRKFPMEQMDMKFTYLTEEAAKCLVDLGIRGVGIDQLGIERGNPKHPTHHVLFAHDKPIIEGLELSDIDEGKYNMVGLPINIDGVEAAPMRVILIEFKVNDLIIR